MELGVDSLNILKDEKIDVIIHTAANKHLIWCQENKSDAEKINLHLTLELFEIAKQKGAKFIFISSDQVFDGKKANSSEFDETFPINYYGVLKEKVERTLLSQSYKNYIICRTALVFGEIPNSQIAFFDSIKNSDRLIVQGFIVQHVKYKLENREKIILPKDEFCNPTYVQTLSKQLLSCINNDVCGIFHCCGGERISRFDFGKKIAEFYNLDGSYISNNSSNDLLRPKDVSLSSDYTQSILKMRFPSINEMLQLMSRNEN